MLFPVLRPLVADRADQLFEHMAGVRDGVADSIHEARVACRRLRELLPLLGDDEQSRNAERVAHDAGRELGRVRDLDVIVELLAQYEDLLTSSVVALALARRTVAEQRREGRRTLIKALERLDLSAIAAYRSAKEGRRFTLPLRGRSDDEAGWLGRLRERIAVRAGAVQEAVEHASGVYFPHRLHGARVAVKKLRYAMEIADATRVWAVPRLLTDLRKVQTTLGDIHDRQVLADRLSSLAGDGAPAPELDAVRGAIEVDIARLHRRYLDRRDRLRAAAKVCARFAVRRPTMVAWLGGRQAG